LARIRQGTDSGPVCVARTADDAAAIIFTSGSTGVAKGVHYTHGIFCTQTEEIQKRLGIQPGDVDLAGFPFFGLFNAAMGVTAVIPDMDSSRPARVEPSNIVEAIRDWNVNQSFGSPALWNRVIDYCLENGIRLETLKRTISAGAPINALMLERLRNCIAQEGEIYTPYGATEALPVSVISASEVLGETVYQTKLGGGICVGNRFPTICWKVVKITDEPIGVLEEAEECPIGEIGELIVSGPQVTTKYVTRVEANALSKIVDETGRIWHRMGDVGYLDMQDRFWFCGRKAHRVETKEGPLYSIPCESVFNEHPRVNRTALVGLPIPNCTFKEPCLFVECQPGSKPVNDAEKAALIAELKQLGSAQKMTAGIGQFRFSDSFPVDVRHNAKINREYLAELAR
ncbi:MAG: fatty acid CoA ligase family protein, partial [Thermoguttaceae bacterium]